MKITLICSTSAPCGVTTHVLSLAKMLAGQQLLEEVVCVGNDWLATALSCRNIPCRSLPSKRLAISAIYGILHFLRKRRGHQLILHAHGRFSAIVAAGAGLLRGSCSQVITLHQFYGSPGSWRQRFLSFWQDALLRRADRIWCVSASLGEETLERMGDAVRDKCEVIPNWIDDLDVPEQCPPSAGPYAICAIGRLAKEKGFDVLIRAVAVLRNRGYAPSCDIYGQGPELDHLHSLCDSVRVRDFVAFRGPVTEARKVITGYSCLVVPSRQESFGLAALEAFAAGIPVIASDVRGLAEIARSGETAIVFPSGNANALAEAIETLWSNRSSVVAMTERARLFAMSQFGEPARRKAVLRFYSWLRKGSPVTP